MNVPVKACRSWLKIHLASLLSFLCLYWVKTPFTVQLSFVGNSATNKKCEGFIAQLLKFISHKYIRNLFISKSSAKQSADQPLQVIYQNTFNVLISYHYLKVTKEYLQWVRQKINQSKNTFDRQKLVFQIKK